MATYSMKAHCREIRNLGEPDMMQQNSIIFLREIFNCSLHPISKNCSGYLVFGQSISLEGRARDKLRDSLISQPSYNI